MFVRGHGPYRTSSKDAWGKVFGWLDSAGVRQKVSVGYGLILDNPKVVAVDQCRYDACIEIPDGFESKVPEQFSLQKLPGGAFVRKRHKGLTDDIAKTISHLRDNCISETGLFFDPNRPVLEIYHDDPAIVSDGERKIDVCVPVSAQQQSDRTAA